MTHLLAAWLCLGPLAVGPPDGDAARGFRERVAPVLERRCVQCHGADDPKGGLSLTTLKGLLDGGDSGPAVEPGKPDDSPLLDSVVGDRPAMPKKGDKLTREEASALRDWIAQGAAWPEGLVLRDRRFEGEAWWAFTPLERPRVPTPKSPGWVRNPIDAFILDRLDAEGFSPAPEADRRTLIRRLSFDLIGLPPTPAEVAAFEADGRADAYERLVDRLLASPHYGERWARHWLDVVHYGDTHGYDKDKRRNNAWPYRDYVIRALNDDLPYGRFVAQQLAGDVLFPDEPDAVVATGFVAAGPWDFVGHVELREGTVDKAKARLNDRDDMLVNAMSTFQSLTVGCARCHDHKFDPIPQADYYRLQAVFAGVDRGDRPRPDPAIDARRKALEARRKAAADRLEEVESRIKKIESAVQPEDARIAELRRTLAATPRPGGGPSPTNGYHSAIHPRPDALAWVQVDLGERTPIDGVRLVPARPTDFKDTPGFGFPVQWTVALSDDPDFRPAATKVVVEEGGRPYATDVDDEPRLVRVGGGLAARYVRVSASRLWKRTDDYVFALAELEILSDGENVALGRPVTSRDAIEAGRWSRAALVDGFDSRAKRPAVGDPAAMRRAEILDELRHVEDARRARAGRAVPSDLRSEQSKRSFDLYGLDALFKKLPEGSKVYALVSHDPRPIHELRRGDVEQPGAEARPGALSCLPGLEAEFSLIRPDDEGARRAALAEWIVRPENMLTWRSMANRVWQYHFGRGLVDTPNDFGRNGSLPTHPELLDWLAAELRGRGQSLKHLHRLICNSAAYRQSSQSNPAGEAKDADNRFLWRQNRRRLDAESLRDAILSVTGTLDPRMGGPGFDLFRFKDDHSPIYDHTAPGAADNPAVRRRTVYRFAVRSVANPFLECLDCADPNINTPVRSTTITALQSLAMMNDAFVVSQAKEFARRLEGSGDPIDAAYRLSLGRPPDDGERAAMRDYAQKFSLASTCRLLLNTNEFLFID